MCSYLMVQYCPRPLATLQRKSIFKLTENEPNDPKGPENIYNLHFDDVRGDIIQPPHGITPAAVKIK